MRHSLLTDLNFTDPIEAGLDLRAYGMACEEWEIRLIQGQRRRFELWEDPTECRIEGMRWHVIDTHRTDEEERALIVRSYKAKLGHAAAADIVDRLNIAHTLRALYDDRARRGIAMVPASPLPFMMRTIRLASPAMIRTIWCAMVEAAMAVQRKTMPGSILAALTIAENNPDRAGAPEEAAAKAEAIPVLNLQVVPAPPSAADWYRRQAEPEKRAKRIVRAGLIGLGIGAYATFELATAHVGMLTTVEAFPDILRTLPPGFVQTIKLAAPCCPENHA